MCSSEEQWRPRRCSSSWSVSDRGRLAPCWWWIARAGGLASKVQKCTTAPVKRSGIAEGAVWSEAVLLFQFWPFLLCLASTSTAFDNIYITFRSVCATPTSSQYSIETSIMHFFRHLMRLSCTVYEIIQTATNFIMLNLLRGAAWSFNDGISKRDHGFLLVFCRMFFSTKHRFRHFRDNRK